MFTGLSSLIYVPHDLALIIGMGPDIDNCSTMFSFLCIWWGPMPVPCTLYLLWVLADLSSTAVWLLFGSNVCNDRLSDNTWVCSTHVFYAQVFSTHVFLFSSVAGIWFGIKPWYHWGISQHGMVLVFINVCMNWVNGKASRFLSST